MPGRPLAALGDRQAIGGGDPASEALWQAHLRRMAERASAAKAVEPDLALAPRDPFGLRYVALLGLVVALLFGSVMRVGSVSQMGPGTGTDLATGPAWEGWIEPPTYTGLPSLYLNDQKGEIRVPEGSRVTLRLYGEVGALSGQYSAGVAAGYVVEPLLFETFGGFSAPVVGLLAAESRCRGGESLVACSIRRHDLVGAHVDE